MRVRRRHERFVRRLETEFTGKGRTYRAISSDFSRYGLFIRTNHAFEPGTELDITVHTPTGAECRLRGVVRRSIKTPVVSLKNGMGIELISRDGAFIKFLKEFDPTESEDPSSSPAPEQCQAPEEQRLDCGADVQPHQKPSSPVPEFAIVPCPVCGIRNKVRSERLSRGFKCGRCSSSLSPQT